MAVRAAVVRETKPVSEYEINDAFAAVKRVLDRLAPTKGYESAVTKLEIAWAEALRASR